MGCKYELKQKGQSFYKSLSLSRYGLVEYKAKWRTRLFLLCVSAEQGLILNLLEIRKKRLIEGGEVLLHLKKIHNKKTHRLTVYDKRPCFNGTATQKTESSSCTKGDSEFNLPGKLAGCFNSSNVRIYFTTLC